MDKLITIYHGSDKIVEQPIWGEGKKNNDFGLGFYCTASEALAKEWAVSSLRDGFSNRYTLNTEYLNILNLNSPDYTILNWIAVLIEHRLFSIKTPVAGRAKKYLIDNFGVNVNAFDLAIILNVTYWTSLPLWLLLHPHMDALFTPFCHNTRTPSP